jgi:hypothetical protein
MPAAAATAVPFLFSRYLATIWNRRFERQTEGEGLMKYAVEICSDVMIYKY